jgi:uncharacterized protein (TIGR02145 family)
MKIILFILFVYLNYNLSSQTVRIGEQEWQITNLDIEHFRNGDPIPKAQSLEEWAKAWIDKKPAWCYHPNAIEGIHGKLYNWYAVIDPRGLAPKGYHIPSNLEWENLVNYLGRENVGYKLKNSSGWRNNGNGSNQSGFSGFASGFRSNQNFFEPLGWNGYWWSTTEKNESEAYYFELSSSGSGWINFWSSKGNGLSIRCIKD